jgi:hypothetical protein
MRYIRNNLDLPPGNAIVLKDGSKVPWANLTLWSEDELTAIGVTALPDPPPVIASPPPPRPIDLADALADALIATSAIKLADLPVDVQADYAARKAARAGGIDKALP